MAEEIMTLNFNLRNPFSNLFLENLFIRYNYLYFLYKFIHFVEISLFILLSYPEQQFYHLNYLCGEVSNSTLPEVLKFTISIIAFNEYDLVC